ncbi:GSCOCG00012446001-RA-CDS, partial [Cotesia congregata]
MDFAIIQVTSGGKKVVQLQNIFLSDDDNKYTIRGTKDLIKQADNGRSKTLRVSINKKLIACTVIEISDDKDYLSSKIKSPMLGRGKRLKPVKRLNFSPGMMKDNSVPSRKVLSNRETNQAIAQKKKIKIVQSKNVSQRERVIIERMRKKLKENAQTT